MSKSIYVICGVCNTEAHVPVGFAGKKVRCKHCKNVITVDDPSRKKRLVAPARKVRIAAKKKQGSTGPTILGRAWTSLAELVARHRERRAKGSSPSWAVPVSPDAGAPAKDVFGDKDRIIEIVVKDPRGGFGQRVGAGGCFLLLCLCCCIFFPSAMGRRVAEDEKARVAQLAKEDRERKAHARANEEAKRARELEAIERQAIAQRIEELLAETNVSRVRAEKIVEWEKKEYPEAWEARLAAIKKRRALERKAKLRAEEEELRAEQARVAAIAEGPKPKSSAWDGSVRCVSDYLEANANDPDSLEWVDWYAPVLTTYKDKRAWAVRLSYRGKNAFGGVVLQRHTFYIRHLEVVGVEEWVR